MIRDADRKSIGEIAGEAHALADRARAGKLTPDEFTGSTFTISNLGMYGIDHFTAVSTRPSRPSPTIKLTLSIDHRVLDGATAAAFEHDFVQVLEEPLRIVV